MINKYLMKIYKKLYILSDKTIIYSILQIKSYFGAKNIIAINANKIIKIKRSKSKII